MDKSQFYIEYEITLESNESLDSKVEALCLEQTVELPRSVISDSIYQLIVAKESERRKLNSNQWYVKIFYPVKNIGDEITQLFNILFGNISLTPGVKVCGLQWSQISHEVLPGPAYGIHGIRSSINEPNRALSCTALKPLGFSADDLAKLAHEFALGGIDFIKDDHGLANQSYAPFEERLKRCCEAVSKANNQTGYRSTYIPHISAPGNELWRRYELAKAYGAGGVMICPHLCSPEVIGEIARSTNPLPVMAHPAFSGSFIMNPSHGFTLSFLYGNLWRAMGADFSIYPNAHGRFSFSEQDCHDINTACRSENSGYRPSFPTPGGGMQRESIPVWLEKYGKNTVFLIGGSLYRHPEGIRKAAEEIRNLLELNGNAE